MKRQLDRLKGKRLVTGDPNLMTKDEICINATSNGVEVKEIGSDGEIKDLSSGGDSSSNENTGQIEYLYICFSMTATNLTRDIMLTYLGNAQIVEYKGKLLIAPTVKSITLASPNTMAGNTPPQYAKIVKGIVTNNGVTCDCTSFDKFIQNEGVDSSKFYEITEEEYNNYK